MSNVKTTPSGKFYAQRSLSRSARGVTWACAVIPLLTFTLGPLAQSEVGYVLTVRGDWFLNGDRSQLVKRWQPLRGGSTVEVKSADERGGSIAIALYDGTTIRKVCANNGECARQIQLPASVGPPPDGGSSPRERKKATTVREMASAGFHALFKHRRRYVRPITTKGGDPATAGLRDSVLPLTGEQVDLSAALEGLGAVSLDLTFEPIGQGTTGGGGPKTTRVKVNWEPTRPSSAFVDGLTPGLYRVSSEDNLHEAWVLIADAAGYASLNNSFAEALSLTQEWGDAVDVEVKNAFLRAYLEQLTLQVAAPTRE